MLAKIHCRTVHYQRRIQAGRNSGEQILAHYAGKSQQCVDAEVNHGLDHGLTNIAANFVVFSAAQGGIGEPGDYLELDIVGSGTLTATAADDIYLEELFGGRHEVLEHRVHLDGEAYTVIGILPLALSLRTGSAGRTSCSSCR